MVSEKNMSTSMAIMELVENLLINLSITNAMDRA